MLYFLMNRDIWLNSNLGIDSTDSINLEIKNLHSNNMEKKKSHIGSNSSLHVFLINTFVLIQILDSTRSIP